MIPEIRKPNKPRHLAHPIAIRTARSSRRKVQNPGIFEFRVNCAEVCGDERVTNTDGA